MRIKSIEIRNYRQYRELDFDFKKISGLKNDLNIIIAENGIGKSNFLNAITWCLYGEESHLQDDDKNKGLPIVNLNTIEETLEKQQINVSVQLVIEHDGEDETIKRQMCFVKNSNIPEKIKWTDTNLYVTKIMRDVLTGTRAPQTITGEDAKLSISRLFPKEISQYFFFDNEQMDNYFKSHSGRSIEKSINDITKISLVKDVNSRLKSLESEYKVNLSSGDTNIERLRNIVDAKEAALQAEKDELDRTEEQISEGQDRMLKLDEKVRGAENLTVLEKTREVLESSIKDLKDKTKDLNDELQRFIVRYMMLINMYPAFSATLKLIEEKDRDRQLPPDISIDILKRSVNQCKCELCENVLDDTHLHKIIEKLNRFNISSPVFELLLSIKHKTIELKKETEEYKEKKEELTRKITSNEESLEKKRKELDDILESMKAISNKDEIKRNIEERESLRRALDNLLGNRGIIKAHITQRQKEYSDAVADFDRAVNAQNRNKDKLIKYQKTKQLREYLSTTENEMINEIRNQISKKTYDNFVGLIWKTNSYKKVEISDNYTVDLIHNSGYSAISTTSAAERALLALSFTNAMHEVSGFESPLVIDSPVGRVSGVNRQKFAESLAEISKNKQIIMLFTPAEYSKEVSDVFDSVAVISRANMNSSETETTFGGE